MKPTNVMIADAMTAMMPIRLARTARPCSRAAPGRGSPANATGKMPRIHPENRPSAVSDLISRRSRSRCGHGVGHGVEQLGQVATDLALDADGHDRPHQVDAGHALGRVLERVLDGPAEARLGEHPLELAAGRLGRLVGDRLEALGEGEPGSHRTREQVQRARAAASGTRGGASCDGGAASRRGRCAAASNSPNAMMIGRTSRPSMPTTNTPAK